MDQEKRQWIEIGLFGIIAVCLIYSTFIDTGDSPSYNQPLVNPQPQSNVATNPQITNNPQTGQPNTLQLDPNQSAGSTPLNVDPNQQQPALSNAVMGVAQTDVNIGTIKAGSKFTHTFDITNTGTDPLTIQDAHPDEGLLIVDRPRAPIPPGGTGKIVVDFLDNNAVGQQTKTVHINSNATESHKHLTISANVVQ